MLHTQETRRRRGASALLIAVGLLWAGARVLWPAPLPRYQAPGRRQPGRRIPFRGAHNLRDLGGYPAADGRTVRWGAIYRSDHLGRLSARDLRWLRALELGVIVDFRSSAERAERPNRLPKAHAIRVVELPIFDDDASAITGSAFKERILRSGGADIDGAAALTEAYQALATTFTPVYRQFVAEVLAARDRPLLFHCTSGKDRTGVAAAILLRLLGVPAELILADYLRSNAYSLAARQRDLLLVRLLRGPTMAALGRTLFGVEAAYLHTAFAAIDSTYGSFEAYARDGLGLGESAIARLREALLERG